MVLGGTATSVTPPPPAPPPFPAAAPPTHTHAWKDGGSFSFHDLLDALNPLQHIPVIGTIYRWMTGDEPGNVARIVGDGLYGGPIGLATGILSVAFKEETGEDPGEMVMAALTGSDPGAGTATGTATAAQSPAPATAAAVPATATASPPAAQATVAAAPAATAHATPALEPSPTPIPLFRSGTAAPLPVSMTAEQDFLARTAAMQRTTIAPRGNAPTRTFTAPIPLQLTGGALRPPPQPMPSPMAAPAAGGAPIDVPQRMMEALDKYVQMQKRRETRGTAVDLSN